MSDTEQTELTLEDAQAALKKVRKADAAKRVKIDELETQLEAGEAKLATLAAYEALGTPDDLKARLAAGDAASKALEESGVSLEELPARIKEAKEAATLRYKITLRDAAEQAQVSEADLTEWLGGRTLTQGKVKGEDGKEADAYGIAEGEEFKPLTGYATLTALAGKSNKPADRPPLPTGQRGGPSKPVSLAQEQNKRAASHLRPKSN